MNIPILPIIAFSLRAVSQRISAISYEAVDVVFLFSGKSHTCTKTSTDRFLTLVLVSAVLRMIAFNR